MTKRIQLQWQNFIRSISNESNENVYKHKDLFTKAQVKINKLREWYIQNVYYEKAAALEKVY